MPAAQVNACWHDIWNAGQTLEAEMERRTRWKLRSISTINRRSQCPDDGREINWHRRSEAPRRSEPARLHRTLHCVVIVVVATCKINATDDGQGSVRTDSSFPLPPLPTPFSPLRCTARNQSKTAVCAPIDARRRRRRVESPSSQQQQQ